MELEPVLAPNIILSDGVIREQGTNKISLMGTFHNFNCSHFPFQTPPFFVTVSLTNLRGKLDGFKIAIRIENKASSLVAASSVIEIGSVAEVTPSEVLQVPIPIACNFASAGLYSVVLLVEGDVIASRDLTVIPVTAAPPQPRQEE
jgi:hypothetical protein